MESPESQVVDLRAITASLRRGWGWVLGGVALGVVFAVLATALITPRYKASATILLREGNDGGGLIAGLAGALPAGLASMGGLGGAMFDTEMEILTSRRVIGPVVDSLSLQLEVVSPAKVGPTALFARTRLPEHVAEPVRYTFAREGGGFRVAGGAAGLARPGVPFRIPGGELTLRPAGLPDRFEVLLVSRDAAIAAVDDGLAQEKAGGEVARLTYKAPDAVTAAAVPNRVVAEYMASRRTVDRGVNQHRYEFLMAHADSTAQALAAAEERLRSFQETSGVVDPEISGQAELTAAIRMRTELEDLEVDSRALRPLAAGNVSNVHELAAYPTLLRTPAMTDLLDRILNARAKRTELLDRRRPNDEDVVALDRSIRELEGELSALARSYVEGSERKQAQLRTELGRYQATLGALPAQSQGIFRLKRDVRRLSLTQEALQTQLVQTRLAAIGEGGDVRPLDAAVVPVRPSWPIPVLNLAGGVLGGLFFGVGAAVGIGRVRSRMRDAWEVELVAGVPAHRLNAGRPLLLGTPAAVRTLLVAPVGTGARARTVAERLAATEVLQGRSAVLADFGAVVARALPAAVGAGASELPARRLEDEVVTWTPSAPEMAPGALRAAVEELEARFDRVFVVLPELEAPISIALFSPERPVVLAGRCGAFTRGALDEAVGTLRRSGLAAAGVVMDAPTRGDQRV